LLYLYKLESIPKWYFPLWSKLDLYRTASDILDESLANIAESSLNSACVNTDPTFTLAGFNRTGFKYDITFDASETMKFKGKGKYGKCQLRSSICEANTNLKLF
jgi:hypothetical protein